MRAEECYQDTTITWVMKNNCIQFIPRIIINMTISMTFECYGTHDGERECTC